MLRSVLIIISLSFFYFTQSQQALAFSFKASKRYNISIVGSSTVYPFAATIAEEFGRNFKSINPQIKTPIVESTGTGGGFKLFCGGVGYNYPDFSDASRPIEKSEIAKCHENGVKGIVEIKIGYDGIVFANSTSGKKYHLNKQELFLALAEKVPNKNGELVENFYNKWSDINPNLPKFNIAIYGPPSTSGTRDAFVELVMEKVCAQMPEFAKAFPDKKIRQKKCRVVRSDGKFIEAGENDNLIVQKLKNDHNALGIFGFSFLEENHDTLQAATINNVDPTFSSIVSGSYEVSRPLFIYFKKEHLDLIAGMRDFVKEIVSRDTIGPDGYLLQKGLIPLSTFELKKIEDETVKSL